jgi:hypothetical protein
MWHSDGAGRKLSRSVPLKWEDDGQLLSPSESEMVFQDVVDHLDKKGVKWRFD